MGRAPVFMQPYLFGESCHFKVSLFNNRNVNLEQHQLINVLSNIQTGKVYRYRTLRPIHFTWLLLGHYNNPITLF